MVFVRRLRFVLLTAIMVAAPIQGSAADVERVVVDFSVDTGPVTYRGSGFLNGFGMGTPGSSSLSCGAPGDRWVAPLKPQAISTHPDNWSILYEDGLFDVYDYARRIGVKYIQVKISDRYGYGYDKEAPWPGDNGNWEKWERCVEELVEAVRREGMVVQWDVFNEPTPGGFWGAKGGTPQYLEAWRRAVHKIRSLDPEADIIGPGMAGFNPDFLREFLQFCKTHDVLPNVLMWHDAHHFADDVAYARKLLAEYSIEIDRFAISEYTGPANSSNAGYSALAFADLERAGVESACRTVNNDPKAPDANIAIHHTLGGLLTPGTRYTEAGVLVAGVVKPRATWWVFKRYADMTGRLLGVTPSLSADGLAAWDPETGKVAVLLGRCAADTAPEGIELVCENTEAVSSIIVDGRVRVVGERIANSQWEPLEEPEVVFDTILPVEGGQVVCPVSPMGPSDAFFVTLTTPSAECPMTQPVPIRDAGEKPSEYHAVRADAITLDGDLGDWEGARFIDLCSAGSVKVWMYQGSEDLSGDFALCWDDENLYFGANITDDALACADSSGSIYMGDSVQIALAQEALGRGWFEISLGRLANGEAVANCFIAPTSDHSTGAMADVRLTIIRKDTTTTYEAAIPWRVLAPMRPEHAQFSSSVLVNDNDGAQRKGWIEWGGGIGEEKARSKFKPCLFDQG